MARNFKTNDVAVLYKYMGDNIPVCRIPALPKDYATTNEGATGTRALSRQELAIRLRLDKNILDAIQKATGPKAEVMSIIPGQFSDDGTGYMFVQFTPASDLTTITAEYAKANGRKRRITNIAISYWGDAQKAATGYDVMPNELAETILDSIDGLLRGYTTGHAALARWNETVTQAKAAIAALQALGMPIPAELQAKANTAKPTVKLNGTVAHKK